MKKAVLLVRSNPIKFIFIIIAEFFICMALCRDLKSFLPWYYIVLGCILGLILGLMIIVKFIDPFLTKIDAKIRSWIESKKSAL